MTFQTCLSPHLLQSHCSDFLQHCHNQHQQVRGQLNDREAKDNTSIHTFLKHLKTLEIMQHFVLTKDMPKQNQCTEPMCFVTVQTSKTTLIKYEQIDECKGSKLDLKSTTQMVERRLCTINPVLATRCANNGLFVEQISPSTGLC